METELGYSCACPTMVGQAERCIVGGEVMHCLSCPTGVGQGGACLGRLAARREGQGKRVEAARNIEEQQEEAQEAHDEDRTLPGGRKGKQHPHVPPHIGQGQQGKEQKDGSPE